MVVGNAGALPEFAADSLDFSRAGLPGLPTGMRVLAGRDRRSLLSRGNVLRRDRPGLLLVARKICPGGPALEPQQRSREAKGRQQPQPKHRAGHRYSSRCARVPVPCAGAGLRPAGAPFKFSALAARKTRHQYRLPTGSHTRRHRSRKPGGGRAPRARKSESKRRDPDPGDRGLPPSPAVQAASRDWTLTGTVATKHVQPLGWRRSRAGYGLLEGSRLASPNGNVRGACGWPQLALPASLRKPLDRTVGALAPRPFSRSSTGGVATGNLQSMANACEDLAV
jgi:hypothetical protein